jgi:hypothetical protein
MGSDTSSLVGYGLAPFTGGTSLAIPGVKALGQALKPPSLTMPTQGDPKVQAAAAAEAAKRRRAMGYTSTILTQPAQQQLKTTTGA